MMPRRDALALLAGLAATTCAAPRRGVPVESPDPAFALDPIVDLVPAPGLVWLVDARPRDLLEHAALSAAFAKIVPDVRMAAFARCYGGADPRSAAELTVARFADTTLGLARMPVDPTAVSAAFTAVGPTNRREAVRGVTRFSATMDGVPERIAMFAGKAIAIERGIPGPLQAAVYFAEGKLRRALPALRAEPLAGAAARLEDAPLRCFLPGPFEGLWAKGLGGLLRATTAVAAAVRPVESAAGSAVAVTLLLLGAWASDAPAAQERLAAAFHVWSESPLGRLTGIDRPVEAPRTTSDAGALRLDVVLDPDAIARGLRDATGATAAQIMGEK